MRCEKILNAVLCWVFSYLVNMAQNCVSPFKYIKSGVELNCSGKLFRFCSLNLNVKGCFVR